MVEVAITEMEWLLLERALFARPDVVAVPAKQFVSKRFHDHAVAWFLSALANARTHAPVLTRLSHSARRS